jgi:hypothetical protein
MERIDIVYDATLIDPEIHSRQAITHPDPKTRVCNGDRMRILAYYRRARIVFLISAF